MNFAIMANLVANPITGPKGAIIMDSEDLVSICTVTTPTEAEIIRNALQAVGIACEIGGEGQAGLAGILAIDVLTHASDLEAARKHLRNLRNDKLVQKNKPRDAKQADSEPDDDASEAIQEIPPSVDIRKAK